jgi:hypothetical protein
MQEATFDYIHQGDRYSYMVCGVVNVSRQAVHFPLPAVKFKTVRKRNLERVHVSLVLLN